MRNLSRIHLTIVCYAVRRSILAFLATLCLVVYLHNTAKCQSRISKGNYCGNIYSEKLLKITKYGEDNSRVVRTLLRKGAYVNISDKDEYTPLLYAAKRHHWKVVQILVIYGANVNPKPRYADANYFTPLMYCAGAAPANIVKLLIVHGAYVNAIGYHAHTALMEAVWAGKKANVQVLISSQADVNKRTYFGHRTALSFAIEEKRQDIVRLLKQRGAQR